MTTKTNRDGVSVHMDGNSNVVFVEKTTKISEGQPLVVVRLAAEPDHGYIAADEGTGGFGDGYPSSYEMPCLTWFGAGERYPDAETALAAVCD